MSKSATLLILIDYERASRMLDAPLRAMEGLAATSAMVPQLTAPRAGEFIADCDFVPYGR